MTICLKELRELPPLSSAAREILKIVHDEDAEIVDFVRIVEQDPALLARIIGLANSAYFGSRSVSNVKRAIIDVLGFRTAKNIALGVVLGGVFNPKRCTAFDLPKFWFLNLLTATMAKECVLKLKYSLLDANDAYLSGMLNEIGLLALAYLHPEEMHHILERESTLITESALKEEVNPIFASEIEIFGKNHYEISVDLLTDWHLPDIVLQVMLESSLSMDKSVSDDAQIEAGDLCQIIQFLRKIAELIYEQEPIELSELHIPTPISEQSLVLNSIIHSAGEQVEAYREMANLLS